MRNKKRTVCFALLLAAAFFALSLSAAAALIPGGDAVAIRLQCDGVIVVGFSDTAKSNPARRAGLKEGDRIVALDGCEIRSDADLAAALSLCGEEAVGLRYVRGKKTCETEITPQKDGQGRVCLGIYGKDSAAGIGTLTFLDPESGTFGCLGHGIRDPEPEGLFPVSVGSLHDARITAVRKGVSGAPGELQGSFGGTVLGRVRENRETGVFGKAEDGVFRNRTPLDVAARDEIREGEAVIRCDVDGTGVREYAIRIVRIYHLLGSTTKNMLLQVTDPDLLEKTGGIVQGMSGSPIIQNGKLVGAVTHVLINDPTSGYGIFIENMLNTANMPMEKAS